MSDWISYPRTVASLEGASLLLVDDDGAVGLALARMLSLKAPWWL
jgi:hypothetical protein